MTTPPTPEPLPSAALRVSLRLATPEDGAACAAIYRPYVETAAVSFELVPPDGPELAARIARIVERTPWIVAEVDGTVRGYAYGSRHRERPAYDWTVETTVYVAPDARGLGLGRATMTALLDILRIQGFHLAVAGVTPPNAASAGLHLALGFERIGLFPAIGWKLEAWHGVEWFGLELAPREPAPAPVRPIGELADDPAVRHVLRAAGDAAGLQQRPS
jgi:L-amino acid N-acyltransferase YncA